MNEMLGRVGVKVGGLVGRKVRAHVSWLGQYFEIYSKMGEVWLFRWLGRITLTHPSANLHFPPPPPALPLVPRKRLNKTKSAVFLY